MSLLLGRARNTVAHIPAQFHPKHLHPIRIGLRKAKDIAAQNLNFRIPSLIRSCSSHHNQGSTSNFPKRHFTSNMDAKGRQHSVAHFLRQNQDRIFANNKAWVASKVKEDTGFFEKLSSGQHPDYLYIGCSDSRVPANEIMGLDAGEVFVHRNIANLVPNTDLNVMSVIEYAVVHLHVKHIVVCGHYNCGGVQAALSHTDMGLLNPWLRNIRDVYRLYEKELDEIEDLGEKNKKLVELNVLEQCRNVIKTAAVQQSYHRHEYPIVHGWVFDLKDGLLKDLEIDFEKVLKSIQKIYNLEPASRKNSV